MGAAALLDCGDVGVVNGAVAFYVAMAWLYIMCLFIFAAADGGQRVRGPVFVGGKGCHCGGCRAGVCVCGTYLS